MTKYHFEIQNCIDVVIEAGNKEEARMKIIENCDDYASRMMEDCYVSEGKEKE